MTHNSLLFDTESSEERARQLIARTLGLLTPDDRDALIALVATQGAPGTVRAARSVISPEADRLAQFLKGVGRRLGLSDHDATIVAVCLGLIFFSILVGEKSTPRGTINHDSIETLMDTLGVGAQFDIATSEYKAAGGPVYGANTQLLGESVNVNDRFVFYPIERLPEIFARVAASVERANSVMAVSR